MSSFNPALGTTKMIGLTQGQPAAAAPPAASSAASSASGGDWDFSFRNLVAIVNPLQHLPVVGTLYRAATGDTIGTPEKIAGDALYGGLWGAVSGIADAAFQAVTGKDMGDTVLALLTGSHDGGPAKTAAATPAQGPVPTPSQPASAPGADVAALTAALEQKGVGGETAQRALFAYRKSMGLQDTVLAAAH